MKYLDREPQVGDRVHSYIFGVVREVEGGSVRVMGDDGSTRYYSFDTLRVIAPEPEVGGVVTADDDLPFGTLIEQTDDAYAVARHVKGALSNGWRVDGKWFADLAALLAEYDAYAWRIVRIGGGPS